MKNKTARDIKVALCWLVVLLLMLASASCSRQEAAKSKGEVGADTGWLPGFLFSIDRKGENNSKMSAPLGVAVSQGKVFVANSGSGEVWVFDLTGRFLTSFAADLPRESAEPTRDISTKSYPVGVVLDEDERLYVSDIQNRRIMFFDYGGQFSGLFPGSPEQRSLLVKPVALAYAGGKLYVTDIGDQSIKVFNRAGKLLNKFGQAGSAKGQLLFPNGVAVAENGTIYVADSNNSRVQVFGSGGKSLFSIREASKERLRLPRALAIDSLDRLHVVDTLAQQVHVFDRKGKFLFSYGRRSGSAGSSKVGTDPEELDLPIGIAVDKETRHIWISDKGSNRVLVWEY